MITKGDFEANLLALSSDHYNSDPFLGLFYRNSDANKGLCHLFQSPLFGVFSVCNSSIFKDLAIEKNHETHSSFDKLMPP